MAENIHVPFVDLAAGIAPHRAEYLAQMTEVLDSAYFAGGPKVGEFEAAFASYCGVDHAVSVSSGTDALILALRGLGVEPGDEVITAANSFFATAEAISLIGAIPVFADVCPDTLTIDPEDVARRVSERTRALVPVHLFGQIANVEALAALAEERGLVMLEDSAQAHGARRNGRRAGAIGAAAGFSFYPAKNLGAFGEGGAVTTGSAEVAERVRWLRDHGQHGKHNHELIGYNARLDAMKCACLTVSLAHLDDANGARRRIAATYSEGLAGVDGIELVSEDPAGEAVYHLFVIRVAERDRIAAELKAEGVDTAIHYPVPIHLQPAYAHLGYAIGDCPVSERAAAEMLSLPMYPGMSDAAVAHVIASVRRVVA